MPSRRRLNSAQRLERQKRKQYEKERPEFGGFIWEAILIGLLGCLFCAGKDFEDNVEKARAIPRDIVEGIEGEGRHRHRHARGRSGTNRSRSISDGSGEHGTHRNGGSRSGYVGYEGHTGGGARDDAVTYVPADEERYQENGGVLGRYAENQGVYMAEESPAPRRRRTRRGESYN